MTPRLRFAASAPVIGVAIAAAAPARAQDDAALRDLVTRQQEQIARQESELETQRRTLDQLASRLAAMENRGGGAQIAAAPAAADPAPAAAVSAPVAAPASAQPQELAASSPTPTSEDTRRASAKPGSQGRQPVMADWKSGGPDFSSPDGFFTFHPRLRLMLDASTTHGSSFAARNISGTEGRSIFLGGQGTVGGMGYKVETDISSQQVSLREAYLSYVWGKGKRQNQIYLGSKINDRGIDASSADTLTPLMERNAVAVLTAGQRGFFGFGLMGRVLDENWHFSVAISGDSASKAGTSNDTFTVAGRAHWSPWLGRDASLHLGGWGYYESLSDGVTSLSRSDPVSTRYNDNLHIDSGPLLNPKSGVAYGLEGGGVFRSAFVMTEYGNRRLRFDDRADANFSGLSIYGGIFLTGEKPNLSRRTGGWEMVHVRSAFTDGGSGAFELVARYDRYKLDNLMLGGDGKSVTVGLNWYVNNWARLMVNYFHWTTNNRSGNFLGHDTGDTVGARASFAF